MDLFSVAAPYFMKAYVISIFLYVFVGAMVVQNDQDTTYGRMPTPWANHPKRFLAGAIFVMLVPVLNAMMALYFLRNLVFNPKRDERLREQYAPKHWWEA